MNSDSGYKRTFTAYCEKKHNKFEKSIVSVRLNACLDYVDEREKVSKDKQGFIERAFHCFGWDPVVYLGYGRHDMCHERHFDGGAKIAWQKLKSVYTVSWTSILDPTHP